MWGLVGRRAQVASTRLHSLSRRILSRAVTENTSESELAHGVRRVESASSGHTDGIGCKRDQRHARADRTARLGQVKVPADYVRWRALVGHSDELDLEVRHRSLKLP